MPSRRTRILIADDEGLLRDLLTQYLIRRRDLTVVASVANGREALAAVERFRPAVVLMDISMPLLDGVDATQVIVQRFPGVRVLICSVHTDASSIRRSFLAGASGFIPKSYSPGQVHDAIATVAAGGIVCPPRFAMVLATQDWEMSGRPNDISFTPRQLDVLALIVAGLTAGEMAKKLGVTAKTIEFHRARIMRKCGVRRTAQLIRIAMARGWVDESGKAT